MNEPNEAAQETINESIDLEDLPEDFYECSAEVDEIQRRHEHLLQGTELLQLIERALRNDRETSQEL